MQLFPCRLSKKLMMSLVATMALTVTFCSRSAAQSAQTPKANGLLVFDLNPGGISPATITVKEGWYVFRVRNGISLSPLNVQLDHETLSTIFKDTIGAGRGGIQRLVNLQQGKHTLTVGPRQAWVATITVIGAN